ncbi:MAG: tetratricopeptide repeat protein [Thermodesulfobacteriota bacterium]
MSYPFFIVDEPLLSSDLELLAPLLRAVVQDHLPCGGVYFVGPQVSGDGLPPQLRSGVEMVRSALQPVKDNGPDPALYLPLWDNDQLCGVAVVAGVAADTLGMPAARLQEKSRMISREMALVKGAALDHLTGLPGPRLLQAALAQLLSAGASGRQHTLVLLEVKGREKDSGSRVARIRKDGAALASLIGHLAPPCHLGQGVFALLWEGVGDEAALAMAKQLLEWQKREEGGVAHVGLVTFAGGEEGSDARDLLAMVWQALETARGRGPFGLCPYASVADQANHPLAPPPLPLARKLGRLWHGVDRFALIEWRNDRPQDLFPLAEAVAGLATAATLVEVGGDRGYLFLPCEEVGQAEEWCRKAQELLAEKGQSFSMGLAFFAAGSGFKKAEMVANSRKALLHTAFYGAATFTIFAGLSLNISGDIYYNEGDLTRAAREYRLGLRLAAKDVNLLNSLGVTYAQMTSYKKAIPLFEQVLEIEPGNFMALCNLGFARLAVGQPQAAITAFEEGLAGRDDYFDPLLQLGKLYLGAENYEEAAAVLAKAEKVGPAGIRAVSHGAVHRYLGEARFAQGKRGEAMASLQRAVRYNARDAASLSLLGLLYGEGGEGVEIACSLCGQAVEIDEQQWRYWYRLALVRYLAHDLDGAGEALARSLALHPKAVDNLLLQARLLVAADDRPAARAAYAKVLKVEADQQEAKDALAQLTSD